MNRTGLHHPVFTVLNEPLLPTTPRRMAPLEPLRDSLFVGAARQYVGLVADKFRPLGYRVVQPSILFNTGDVPAQEPHQDGEVFNNEFPTLSVLINPLHKSQAVWIAKRSHRPGRCHLERVNIPSLHVVALRHDVCHAGFGTTNPGDKLTRIHLNLVHRSDMRTVFDFDQYVIACIRGAFGSRFVLPSSGEFDHVAHHVNHNDDEDGQGQDPLNDPLSDNDEPEPEPVVDNEKKRKAVSALGPVLEGARERVRTLEEQVLGIDTNLVGINTDLVTNDQRLEEATRLVREYEAVRQAAIDERNRIAAERTRITAALAVEKANLEGFEFLLSKCE